MLPSMKETEKRNIEKELGSNPSPATKVSSIKLVLKARHTVGLLS